MFSNRLRHSLFPIALGSCSETNYFIVQTVSLHLLGLKFPSLRNIPGKLFKCCPSFISTSVHHEADKRISALALQKFPVADDKHTFLATGEHDIGPPEVGQESQTPSSDEGDDYIVFFVTLKPTQSCMVGCELSIAHLEKNPH
jgi:hypothetical protein